MLQVQVQVQVRVRDDRDAIDESTSLLEWLDAEPDLRGRVTREQRPPAQGEMGALSDVLVAVVTGGGVTALARSVQLWLRQRRADVKIELERSDGYRVKVQIDRASDPQRIVKEVLGEENREDG